MVSKMTVHRESEFIIWPLYVVFCDLAPKDSVIINSLLSLLLLLL